MEFYCKTKPLSLFNLNEEKFMKILFSTVYSLLI